MLFLLPPSETKAIGGGSIKVTQSAIIFGALNPARDELMQAYIAASGDKEILQAPTMPAIERYTGTLYSAIHGRGLKGTATANNKLTTDELARAKSMVLIQSALFGLVAATDLIPNYKISPNKLINGLNLKKHWAGAHEKIWSRITDRPIIDLRSKSYAKLAPLPNGFDPYTVTVYLQREDGSREQLNHFNKKAKGQLVRAALTATKAPETIVELKRCAKRAGLDLEVSNREITLITNHKS